MSFWLESTTVKLNPDQSKQMIHALRIGDKRKFQELLIALGLIGKLLGAIATALLAVAAFELDEWADSIQKALRKSPVLGTSVRIGIKPKLFRNPPITVDLEAKPRKDYDSLPRLRKRPPK